MSTNKITDIFFDLDHTLWDFERNSALTFGFIFEKHKLQIELEAFLETYSPINSAYWALYRNNKIKKMALRYQRLADTFLALNMEFSDETINSLSEDYILHLANYNHLFPETMETLNYLQANYNLHIITNGFMEIQDKKLKNSKIDGFFKTVTTSDEVGVKKPHPQIFEIALEKANAQKESSLMVGDNLEADILGAEHYGLQSIFFDPSTKQVYDGQKISTIAELKTYF